MFKEKNRRKILESKLKLVDLHLKIHQDMLDSLMTLAALLKDRRFKKAAGPIFKILHSSDFLKKQTKMHMTQEITGIFEADAKLSYSLVEVEGKRDAVFKWLDEIKPIAKQLQVLLRQSSLGIDPKEIYHSYDKLHEKICCDLSLMDYVNTLTILASESVVHQTIESTGRLFIFNNLKLHPVIRKSSEKLFRDGHYSSAIFEAYKALNNYVKKKSKRGELSGKSLMATVFKIEYDKETDQIQKTPSLQLSELRNRSDRDEQEGFMLLFMGAMQGIRNPKAHDQVVQKDPLRTLEYLCFAILLAKRVDEAKLNR